MCDTCTDLNNRPLSWPKEAPHSRACGIRQHEHGAACHWNCPTCGGREPKKVPRDWIEQVKDFHRVYGHPIAEKPGLISHERAELRYDLIAEELDELNYAMQDENLREIADALGDLLVVVIGAALEYGIPLEPVMAAIYRSNMSKLDDDGKPIYAPNGKVLKGPNFKRPDKDILVALYEAGWDKP